ATGPGWQTFPAGPHNSGIYFDTNNVPSRFYRIRAVPASLLAPFRVTISQTANPGQVRLTYPVIAGYNYTIESRSSVATGPWQAISGAPHNSGNVVVNTTSPAQFFRVSAAPMP